MSASDPLGYRSDFGKAMRSKGFPLVKTNQPMWFKYEYANEKDYEKEEFLSEYFADFDAPIPIACITPSRSPSDAEFKRQYDALAKEMIPQMVNGSQKITPFMGTYRFQTGWAGKVDELQLAGWDQNQAYPASSQCFAIPVDKKWGDLRDKSLASLEPKVEAKHFPVIKEEPKKSEPKATESPKPVVVPIKTVPTKKEPTKAEAEKAAGALEIGGGRTSSSPSPRPTYHRRYGAPPPSKLTAKQFEDALIAVLKSGSYGYPSSDGKCLCMQSNSICDASGKQSLWSKTIFRAMAAKEPKVTIMSDLFIASKPDEQAKMSRLRFNKTGWKSTEVCLPP